MNSTKNICEVPQEEINDRTNLIAEKDGRLVKVNQDRLLQNKKPIEKVLLYYGYPIAINGAWSVQNAANIYKTYDICIFGNAYSDPVHETYADTVAIFRTLKEEAPKVRLVGYVPIGAMIDGESDSNLTMDQLKGKVDQWQAMGVDGIFLDEYGYDYHVTRARQNEIVQYCKEYGLFIFANSWSLEYVFSPDPIKIDWLADFDPNPNGLPCLLDEKDYYLYENLFYTTRKNGQDSSLTLECSSVWRIDDVIGYYTREKINGKSYYETFGTKLCSLDAIPSTTDATTKNVLQSISIIGAAILSIHAVAFGDENWGANGYFNQWDLPSIDLTSDGTVRGVAVETKDYTDLDGKPSNFPYKWTANMNGHTYSVVFDIPDPDHITWVDGMRYAMMNDVKIENAWMTVFDFQTAVRIAAEKAESAIVKAEVVEESVTTIMPQLEETKINMDAAIESVKTELNTATKELDAVLQDMEILTTGFQYQEREW